ncbi:hypothetical protein BSLG_008283 [Batrachochytrium salamandrivorans]|nr:hypothetical protein BSLG_008283 [Batrachochytrium salamandrivorans]
MPTTSDTSARSSRAGRSGSALVTQDSANNINSGTMHGHTAVLGEANEQTYNSSHGRRNQPQRELHLAKDAGSDVTAEIPGPYRQATLSELLLLNSSYAWAGVQDSFAWPIALFVVYGLIKNVVSDAYRGLLVFNFIVQVSLIYQLPLVGPVASFILSNFIFAFFAFEYKWINRKWSLSQQVDFFELHWAYFSGFGRIINLVISDGEQFSEN